MDYNKPETWNDVSLYESPVDLAVYQARIDAIFPLLPNGARPVRIVWMASKECFTPYYSEWDLAGQGTKTELRARYRFATIRIPGTKDYIDIPPPRFAIEEYNHPSQYYAGEGQYFVEDGLRKERRPPIKEGFYSNLFTIAAHNDFCCREARENKLVCWGEYRLPDERDFERLRAAKHHRDTDPLNHQNPNEQISDKTLENAALEAKTRIERQEQGLTERTREFVEENAYPLIEMFTGASVKDKLKKYSLPK